MLFGFLGSLRGPYSFKKVRRQMSKKQMDCASLVPLKYIEHLMHGGSSYNVAKAIFYLLKGDYNHNPHHPPHSLPPSCKTRMAKAKMRLISNCQGAAQRLTMPSLRCQKARYPWLPCGRPDGRFRHTYIHTYIHTHTCMLAIYTYAAIHTHTDIYIYGSFPK